MTRPRKQMKSNILLMSTHYHILYGSMLGIAMSIAIFIFLTLCYPFIVNIVEMAIKLGLR